MSDTPRTKAIFEKALAAAERAKDGTVKQMLDALLGAIHDDVSQLERELSAKEREANDAHEKAHHYYCELQQARAMLAAATQAGRKHD